MPFDTPLNRPKRKRPRNTAGGAIKGPNYAGGIIRGGGGGGRPSGGNPYGGGGGGGGGRPSGGAPSLGSWLGQDADYQDQLRAFQRSLSDFSAETKRRRGKVEADYSSGAKQMGTQRVKDLSDIMNDFASRGLLKSGLFGARQSEYEQTYNTNLGELGKNRKGLLDDIGSEESQFKRQQALAKETARKEAARRRAEKYGI